MAKDWIIWSCFPVEASHIFLIIFLIANNHRQSLPSLLSRLKFSPTHQSQTLHPSGLIQQHCPPRTTKSGQKSCTTSSKPSKKPPLSNQPNPSSPSNSRPKLLRRIIWHSCGNTRAVLLIHWRLNATWWWIWLWILWCQNPLDDFWVTSKLGQDALDIDHSVGVASWTTQWGVQARGCCQGTRVWKPQGGVPSAQTPPKTCLKDVYFGYCLPLPHSNARKIPCILLTPMNIQKQNTISKLGQIVEKDRLTHNQSFKWSSGTSINNVSGQTSSSRVCLAHESGELLIGPSPPVTSSQMSWSLPQKLISSTPSNNATSTRQRQCRPKCNLPRLTFSSWCSGWAFGESCARTNGASPQNWFTT